MPRAWLIVTLATAAACARTPRPVLEPEPTVTRTWIGRSPAPPPVEANAPPADVPAPPAADVPAPATTTPTTAATSTTTPARSATAAPPANPATPPPATAPRGGWARGGSWTPHPQ